MSQSRKKPIKIEIIADLFKNPSNSDDYIPLRDQSQNKPHAPSHSSESGQNAKALTGAVKIRREVKGRAGKPVTVLFDFSDPNAMHSLSLKTLQAQLKEKLACGGTFDDEQHTVILQVDDLQRVRTLLEKLGFSVKG